MWSTSCSVHRIPVLSWWASYAALTEAATTLTMLAILILGMVLFYAARQLSAAWSCS